MSVDTERHTLTHTHSHARTHAGPSVAPPAPPPTFVSKQVAFSGPFSAGDFSRPAADRGRSALVPSRPGRGWGEGAPGSYRLACRVRAGAPGPAPPRRQDRRGRGRRGGTGRAAPPRAALLRPCRPHCDLTRCELRCPSSVVRAERGVPCLPLQSTGKALQVLRKESPSLTVGFPGSKLGGLLGPRQRWEWDVIRNKNKKNQSNEPRFLEGQLGNMDQSPNSFSLAWELHICVWRGKNVFVLSR